MAAGKFSFYFELKDNHIEGGKRKLMMKVVIVPPKIFFGKNHQDRSLNQPLQLPHSFHSKLT
jgi:hypothetical protein